MGYFRTSIERCFTRHMTLVVRSQDDIVLHGKHLFVNMHFRFEGFLARQTFLVLKIYSENVLHPGLRLHCIPNNNNKESIFYPQKNFLTPKTFERLYENVMTRQMFRLEFFVEIIAWIRLTSKQTLDRL